MDWDNLLTFLTLLRSGGISSTVGRLGISPATVRRRIAQLEHAAGQPLFTADGRKLTGTATALKLAEVAERIEREAGLLTTRPRGPGAKVEGDVRITVSEDIAITFMTPFLAEIRTRHPRLTLKLSVTPKVEDLIRGEADIAVRLVRPHQKALNARAAGHTRLGFFAHRRYVEQVGAPGEIADLPRFDVIGSPDDGRVVRLARAMNISLPPSIFTLKITSQISQIDALCDGLGIGVTLAAVAAQHPGLVPVLPEIADEVEFWVVMHEDLVDSPRMRLVQEALATYLERRLAAGQGG